MGWMGVDCRGQKSSVVGCRGSGSLGLMVCRDLISDGSDSKTANRKFTGTMREGFCLKYYLSGGEI